MKTYRGRNREHLTLNEHDDDDDDDIQRSGVIAPLIRAYISSSLSCIKIAVGPQEIRKCSLRIFIKMIPELS